MAKHMFVVEKGEGIWVGKTVAWTYDANSEGITFHNAFSVPDIHMDGNFIGQMICFKADGKNSAFLGRVKLPNDDRLVYLWKKGFRRGTRSLFPDVVSQMVNKHGGYEQPSHYENDWTVGEWTVHNMKHYITKAPNGEILFNAITGRVGDTNHTDTLWYLNDKASLYDVMVAFDEHLGFSEYTWDIANSVHATKINMKPGLSYCVYKKKMADFTARWIVVEERDEEEFNPEKLGDINYERRWVVAYTTEGENPSDDFRTLERLLDAVDWSAEKITAEEKFEKNKAWCREHNLPCFIPTSGKCFACRKPVFSDGNRGPKWDEFVTGCPHCHRTFCD